MTDAVIEFAKWVIQESVFDGYDLDGGIVHEKALELGLLTKTSYDPEKHGGNEYAKPGSDWYVFSNLLTQTDPSPAPEAQLAARTGGVKVKALEWEDADEGMCTKWRAAALGGHYDLVAFEKEPGFAVNFHWGRPLSFWFIQGEPDEWGPTGPKMFRTLEAAKAAAQADYERRILSTLEPAAPESEPRPMTGFFSNLSPEGQAAALAYDGPEPNIGDTAPEAQQEAVAEALELSGNTGELIDRMAAAIRDWGSHYDDGPWETLPEDCKAGWRGDAERALAVVKEYLTTRRPSEQAVTEAWRPIETAPRNESGQSYGPWLLVFHKYDHGVYQARWECHGDKRGWFAKGEPKSIFSNYITHWMPLPTPPALASGERR